MPVCAGLQMPIQLHRELDACVSHLFRYVSDRSTIGQKQGSEGMAQIMKSSGMETDFCQAVVRKNY